MFSNTIDKIRLLFRKDKEPYLCFYRMTGFYPRNINIYKQALLHKSSSIKNEKGRLLNNERLEFLGDAILDAVVADIVYKRFEGKREGFLTNTRSKIVQRETLNHIAGQIGLDFKSKLIEWSQKNKFQIEFNLVNQSLDDELNPIFNTQILVENVPAGTGKGYSKKESQQEAAHETLRKIKSDPQFIDAIFTSKAEREKETDPVYTEDSPSVTESIENETIDIREEIITERYDDTERIIAEAEEAAFREEANQSKTSANS